MTGKFRVWYYGEMWYPGVDKVEWYLDQNGCACYLLGEVERFPEAAVMFATGHTVKDADGNDRELYDGDIVEWQPVTGYASNITEIIRDVDSCQYVRQFANGDKVGLTQRSCPQLVILGNRYEDAELLKGSGE